MEKSDKKVKDEKDKKRFSLRRVFFERGVRKKSIVPDLGLNSSAVEVDTKLRHFRTLRTSIPNIDPFQNNTTLQNQLRKPLPNSIRTIGTNTILSFPSSLFLTGEEEIWKNKILSYSYSSRRESRAGENEWDLLRKKAVKFYCPTLEKRSWSPIYFTKVPQSYFSSQSLSYITTEYSGGDDKSDTNSDKSGTSCKENLVVNLSPLHRRERCEEGEESSVCSSVINKKKNFISRWIENQTPASSLSSSSTLLHSNYQSSLSDVIDKTLVDGKGQSQSMMNLGPTGDQNALCPLPTTDDKARSMEFLPNNNDKNSHLLPPENSLLAQSEKVRKVSEHELRIQRSLSKLNVPDWYKKYSGSNEKIGSCPPNGNPPTHSPHQHPPPSKSSTLGRKDYGSSSGLAGGWAGLSHSKTSSLTSLQSSGRYSNRTTPTSSCRYRTGGRSGDSLASPSSTASASPSPYYERSSFTYGMPYALSRFASARMSCGASPSSLSPSPSPVGGVGSSATSTPPGGTIARSSSTKTPYLGWRSQERLGGGSGGSKGSYRSPSERLAAELLLAKKDEKKNMGESNGGGGGGGGGSGKGTASSDLSLNNSEESTSSNKLNRVRSSIKEVSNAIVDYVNESKPLDDGGSGSNGGGASPRRNFIWLESSFVGSKPLDSPPHHPHPLPSLLSPGRGRSPSRDLTGLKESSSDPPNSIHKNSNVTSSSVTSSNATNASGGSPEKKSEKSTVGGGGGVTPIYARNVEAVERHMSPSSSISSPTLDDILDSLLALRRPKKIKTHQSHLEEVKVQLSQPPKIDAKNGSTTRISSYRTEGAYENTDEKEIIYRDEEFYGEIEKSSPKKIVSKHDSDCYSELEPKFNSKFNNYDSSSEEAYNKNPELFSSKTLEYLIRTPERLSGKSSICRIESSFLHNPNANISPSHVPSVTNVESNSLDLTKSPKLEPESTPWADFNDDKDISKEITKDKPLWTESNFNQLEEPKWAESNLNQSEEPKWVGSNFSKSDEPKWAESNFNQSEECKWAGGNMDQSEKSITVESHEPNKRNSASDWLDRLNQPLPDDAYFPTSFENELLYCSGGGAKNALSENLAENSLAPPIFDTYNISPETNVGVGESRGESKENYGFYGEEVDNFSMYATSGIGKGLEDSLPPSPAKHRRVSFDLEAEEREERSGRSRKDSDTPVGPSIVSCRNSKCGKSASGLEARREFKTCHNCNAYYCSRECRRAHWEKHKKVCMQSRVGALCKQIISQVREEADIVMHLSQVGRRGWLAKGRGCVKIFFSSPDRAERFLTGGFPELPEPLYIPTGNILPEETGGTVFSELSEQCGSYNPENRFILYVCLCVVNEVPTSGAVKWEREMIGRSAKVRLSLPKGFEEQSSPHHQAALIAHLLPDKKIIDPSPPFPAHEFLPPLPGEGETLILTSVPIPSNRKLSSGEHKRMREVTFTNIHKHLSQRGVELRKTYPDIYSKLRNYVESDEPFLPLTIYPRNKFTDTQFTCIIMPECSEPPPPPFNSPQHVEIIDITPLIDHEHDP